MKFRSILSPVSLAAIALAAAAALLTSCPDTASKEAEDGKLKVVATTGMVGELAERIGGGAVAVETLMGPGIDPRLYAATEGDVIRMGEADLILYSGHHLEGKMTDVFRRVAERGRRCVAVAEAIPDGLLLSGKEMGTSHDPHVWFDVSLWKLAAREAERALSEASPQNAREFSANLESYLGELDELDEYVRARAAELSEERRVLITAHDAFGYFGKAYGFEVRGLQGISTASEAGAADVRELADFIAQRKIPAIFVETSVPHRSIVAIKEAVRSRGFRVEIGGELFSDAMGTPGTPEGTYVGMVRHNIDTIVNALKGQVD